jgi:ATP-dependent Lon protease
MASKRKLRAGRSRTCSENMSDDGGKPPPKKKNRQRRSTIEDGTIWIDDDTLLEEEGVLKLKLDDDDEEDEDDSDYVPSDDEEEEEEESEEEEEDEDAYITVDEDFAKYLLNKFVSGSQGVKPSPQIFAPSRKTKPNKKDDLNKVPMVLSKNEQTYYNNQPNAKKRELLDMMTRLSNMVLNEGDIPHKFRVLQLPISDYIKSSVIKKIECLSDMSDSGEGHKLRNWLDAFMRIPFGKSVPLPIQLKDGTTKCTEFMVNARKQMDTHIYGMEPAKLQIMQTIAQWIVNPNSVGNVIALQGPMGVGKTSFARNAIAEVLQRPFEFFTLGGASDIANFIGHSYTYEGSMWGRIADSLMHAKNMNPVMYFDELDKVSTTPQGDEIVSMMIHMTDRSQNTQFHDRYFAGVDFDLSQCLFVFSFNDIDKVHPILRDRMNVIHCGGYSEKDKTVILKDYIWPQILERLSFKKEDVTLSDSAINFVIEEYSKEEKGVRTLIRTIESMMTRINMLRVAKHESMKDYKFYMDIELPLTITEETVKHILIDFVKKDPESWKTMYC